MKQQKHTESFRRRIYTGAEAKQQKQSDFFIRRNHTHCRVKQQKQKQMIVFVKEKTHDTS